MEKRRMVKWMLAAMLVVLSLTLTGCYETPDHQSTGTQSGGTGSFPTYPPATQAPAIVTKAPVTQNPFATQTNPPIGGTVSFPTQPPQNTGSVTLPNTGVGGSWNGVSLPTIPGSVASGDPTLPPTLPSATPIISGPLKLGHQGELVREVQRQLKNLGFYSGQTDGDYGPATEEAVKAFQAQYGLTPDGVAGEATITKLAGAKATMKPATTPAPTGSIKLGSTGENVRTIQRRLKDLKFYNGSVDGDFGEGTEEAVKRFQRQYGLDVDGKVGAATLDALRNARATAKPAYLPVTPTPRPTATPAFSQNTYLRKGNSGSDVRKMQERLISLGYLAGEATSRFDEATEAGVIAFQKRNCSYWDGVAGPDTLKALYSSSARSTSTAAAVIGVSLKVGSEGSAVRYLQTKLKSLGYYTGSADGSYGSGTEAAVKAFQKANGLKADGKAGTDTINMLYSDDAKTAAQARPTATPKPKPTARPTATPYRTATPLPAGTWVKVTPIPGEDLIYLTLRPGNYGTPVEKLQKALKDQGYYTGETDGYYGSGTEAAVKKFQTKKGLSTDGVAGPATLRYLYYGDFPDGA